MSSTPSQTPGSDSVKRLSDLATLVSLCKRRGFVFQSSEIYGGLSSCWDYGPLGANLKMNVKRAWWNAMTRREDIVGLDAAILMHPTVWKASGHIDTFTDPLVDCKNCKSRFRPDNTESYLERKECPNCASKNLTEPRLFNLMFKTHMGPAEDAGSIVFLRPETAQGHFVNFENIQTTSRKKIPFGIAAIGKSFRNEITPGNFIFRTREFEQMEMQFFVKPGTDMAWWDKWRETRWNFLKSIGINEAKLRFHMHPEDKLAHYALKAGDIEYEFPFGWQELEGIHNRSDFDLTQHAKFSGKKLEYFDEVAKEKYVPYVVETAIGCDRLVLTVMCDAYREEITAPEPGPNGEPPAADAKPDIRIVMGFHPELAPYKVALLPLSKKAELQGPAMELRETLARDFDVTYDDSQSIGKRYRRQDEIGTPYCVTFDFDSLNDKKVTVRHRDTMKQDRIDISQVSAYVAAGLKSF
jgi:glycyl-tRNA synthetase